MTEVYSSIPIERGGTKRQFYFRAKSSDENVIDAIFVKRQYDMFRGLPRVREILTHARNIHQSTGKKPLVGDAGANIGASSISLSGSIPDPVVVAIAPDAGMGTQTKHQRTKHRVDPRRHFVQGWTDARCGSRSRILGLSHTPDQG